MPTEHGHEVLCSAVHSRIRRVTSKSFRDRETRKGERSPVIQYETRSVEPATCMQKARTSQALPHGSQKASVTDRLASRTLVDILAAERMIIKRDAPQKLILKIPHLPTQGTPFEAPQEADLYCSLSSGWNAPS